MTKLSLIALACWIAGLLPSLAQSLPQPLTATEAKIRTWVEEVRQDRIISQIDPTTLVNLPVGVLYQQGEARGVIAFDSARANPSQGWVSSAYAIIELSNAVGAQLLFASDTVALVGVRSNRLMLIADQTLRLPGQGTLQLSAKAGNYLELACDGAKTLHLEGTFTLEDAVGEAPPFSFPAVITHPAQLANLAATARRAFEHSPAAALNPVWVTPNPSDGRFQLRAPRLHPLLLQVYDPLGREVMRQQWEPREAAQETFQLPHNAPAGCYLVRLLSQEGIHTTKLLLRR